MSRANLESHPNGDDDDDDHDEDDDDAPPRSDGGIGREDCASPRPNGGRSGGLL